MGTDELLPMGLHELSLGERGRVLSLLSGDSMRRRLRDIGLIEGTVIECVGESPLGDPRAYLLRGAVIALRRTDASLILIQRLGEECRIWD